MTAVALDLTGDTVPAPPPVCELRAGRASDWPLIIKSWLMGDRHTAMGRAMGAAYLDQQEITIRSILSWPGVFVRVAHVEGDDDAIHGFAVVKPTAPAVIFYVYVKAEARRLHVARTLLHDLIDKPAEYASQPAIRDKLPIPKAWTFNPTRLYRL